MKWRLLSFPSLLCFASLAGAVPEPLTLTLTSPAGGEEWAAGSLHHVTWKATGIGDATVRAEASADGGATWAAIGTADANAGSVLWKVPAMLTDKCLVRLTAARVPAARSTP